MPAKVIPKRKAAAAAKSVRVRVSAKRKSRKVAAKPRKAPLSSLALAAKTFVPTKRGLAEARAILEGNGVKNITEESVKDLAIAKARLRYLLKNRPPCRLPKGCGIDIAKIRAIVEEVGGFDDIFPLPPRSGSRPPPFAD